MVSDVFGLEQQCILVMEIDSIFLNFSQKAGQEAKWMVNYLLTEGNFHKHYRLSEKMCQLINNGKKLDILFLMHRV
jgi:hypothetical protein